MSFVHSLYLNSQLYKESSILCCIFFGVDRTMRCLSLTFQLNYKDVIIMQKFNKIIHGQLVHQELALFFLFFCFFLVNTLTYN